METVTISKKKYEALLKIAHVVMPYDLAGNAIYLNDLSVNRLEAVMDEYFQEIGKVEYEKEKEEVEKLYEGGRNASKN